MITWLRWLPRWRGEWGLAGHDAFAGERYHLPGRYRTEAAAQAAARGWLRELERSQPSATSGGQDGLQDQVYVIRPDGSSYRVLPDEQTR